MRRPRVKAARRPAHLSRRGHSTLSLNTRSLRFESLEDRRMLAVFTVSNLDDVGAGSLREAITMANSVGGADMIDFSVTGTINITSQLPTITDSLTITGPGASLLTIDAGDGTDNEFGTGDGYRIFNIDDGTGTLIDVTLSGLMLTGGDTARGFDGAHGIDGASGADQPDGLPGFNGAPGTNGTSPGENGGNGMPGGPGEDGLPGVSGENGTNGSDGTDGEDGGAIRSTENLTIISSTITGNATGRGGQGGTGGRGGDGGRGGNGGAGGNGGYGGNGSVEYLEFMPPAYGGDGGDGGDGGNGGEGGNGGYGGNGGFGGNGGRGGGVFNMGGVLTITNSTISGNVTGESGAAGPVYGSGYGGAGGSGGNFGVGGYGGGNSFGEIDGLPGQDGQNGYGGNPGQGAPLPQPGVGGIGGSGGGIFSFGTVNVTSSTISGNATSFVGGGIYNYGTATLNNTIVANSVSGGDIISFGTLSGSYNLIEDGSGGPGLLNTLSGDPLLGPLADNGGPTLTHSLLLGSVAIDAGDPNVAFNPTEFDQRGSGFPRVKFGRLDIGAFEFGDINIPVQGLVVDTTSDVFDNDYSLGNLSLREAIFLANANAGANTISFSTLFDTVQEIDLLAGELVITESLTITGPGQDLLTIDAQQNSRVLNFSSTTGDLTLSGLTLTGGQTAGDGGGILFNSSGALTLTSSTVSGNSTTGDYAGGGGIHTDSGSVSLTSSAVSGNSTAGHRAHGGGIHSNTGSVSLTNSTASGNITTGNSVYGGGIHTDSGSVSLTNSVVSGNSTSGNGSDGGGIFTIYGSVTLSNSMLSGNSTMGIAADGGGIFTHSGSVSLTNSVVSGNSTSGVGAKGGAIRSYTGIVSLTNSTVSGNSTTGDNARGGGIYTISGSVSLTNSTVSGNSTTGSNADGGGIFTIRGGVSLANSTVSGNASGGAGGGVFAFDTNYNPPLTITNSIVAGNTANTTGPDLSPDPQSTLTVNYSLIGTGITPTGGSNNVFTNTPLLGPLANNGGPTLTHALLAGSPALDMGDPGIVFSPAEFDQRGAPFARVFGGRIDIGAYERQTVAGLSLVVDTTADENDGDYSAGNLSLREAINLATGSIGPDTITFDPTLFGTQQTISLGSQLPTITDDLTITGPGQTLLTLDAGNGTDGIFATGDGFRIFNIDDGNSGNQIDIEISGLMLTGGDANGSGGAISSHENLTVTSSTINGNSAGDDGGGIMSDGTIYVNSSTISDNSAALGGGLWNSGTATVTNSTLSGNSASHGGGILNYGTANVSSSTISDNSTGDRGGGIWNSGTANVTTSTISDNSTGDLGGGIWNGGTANVTSSTISGNSANIGGGVLNFFGAATLNNVIVGNSISGGDIFIGLGTLTGSYNLVEDGSGGPGLLNTTSGDPLLGPLADNGGPTLTHALLPGSLAINAGDPAVAFNPTEFDQRGSGYSRVQFGRVDIGAFELSTVDTAIPAGGLEVDTTADEFNGLYISGDLSLREAIFLANSNAGANTITFSSLFDSVQTIALTSQLPTITDDLTITGPGQTLLTLDAGHGTDNLPGTGDGWRIFNIDDGTGSLIDVTLSGLTLTGGDIIGGLSSAGGAIRSYENLTIFGSDICDNATLGDDARGGGIFSRFGSLVVSESIISGNSTAGIRAHGGGISSLSSNVMLTNNFISGNSTTGNYAGGGGVSINSANITTTGGTFSGNFTLGNNAGGGGISSTLGDMIVVASTISGNFTQGSSAKGGGVYSSSGTLTVLDSTVRDNFTSGTSAEGGGILNSIGPYGGTFGVVGKLTVVGSNINRNSTSGDSAHGGGIYSILGELSVTGSTISHNQTSGNFANGGGIVNNSGNLTVSGSTFSDNSASNAGGAIFSNTDMTDRWTLVTGSTISGNSAVNDRGGGIFNSDGLTVIEFSTITANSAPLDRGGGVASQGNPFTRTEVSSSIIAGNTNEDVAATNATTNSIYSNGYNLIGTGNSYSGGITLDSFNQIGDMTGVTIPLLGPLADNGGPTETHSLLAGSPAIDAGDPSIVFSTPEFDQRGAPFARLFARIDIGAYELQKLTVDTVSDASDGNYSAGNLSLREAIELANVTPGADTITFDPTLFGTQQTILLASQLPTITADLTITGPGQTLLTLDAGNGTDNLPGTGDGFRIFNITDGTGNLIDVTLTGLTLTGGDYSIISPGNGGGAIFSRENLTIVSSTISGNSAVRGGGIFNYFATANITSSTISGNSSSSLGGGIYNRYGIANIISSTISGNLASGGGGIFNTFATANFTNSTFSGNSASANGGGILNQYGEANLVNSSVSGNSAGGSGGGIYNKTGTFNATSSTLSGNSAIAGGGFYNRSSGTATLNNTIVANSIAGGDIVNQSGTVTGSNNLIEDGSGGPGLLNTISGDPLLGPLADNGGPTLTHALLPGSPAIDAVDGPAAFYRFEEVNNVTATDAVDAHPGVYQGVNVGDSGPLNLGGSAARFIGDFDSHVSVENTFANSQFSGGYTIDFWVYPEPLNGPATQQNLVVLNSADDLGLAAGVILLPDLRIRFANDGDPTSPSGTSNLTSTTTLQTNTWYHIAAVHDGTEMRIYIDGLAELNTLSDFDIYSGETKLTLGRATSGFSASPRPFTGLLDEVAIFDRVLSEAEIAQHTQQGIAGTDQRGLDRYVVGDVNAIAGNASRADIGAYEVQGLNLVVDTLDDESDGDFSVGNLSLREAIERSNTFVGADTITFDPTLFGTQQTIALTSQLPTIIDALSITGPGQTLLTLDAGNGTDNLPGTGDGFRIFNIDDGIYGNEIDVLLSGLTLTGGDVAGGDLSGRGGAIFNRENLSVTNSTLSCNSAFIDGGGVSNSVGKLTLVTTELLQFRDSRSLGSAHLLAIARCCCAGMRGDRRGSGRGDSRCFSSGEHGLIRQGWWRSREVMRCPRLSNFRAWSATKSSVSPICLPTSRNVATSAST